ncbi:MAG: hypothetical protein RR552_05425 [Oscillospiraceae bacterium]
MTKIIDCDIFDIIPFSAGVLFVKKETLANNSLKATFFAFDINNMRLVPAKRSTYLTAKFGDCYENILNQINDYVFCDTDVLQSNKLVTVFPSGETGVFNADGENIWSGDLLYHNFPVKGVAAHGALIWCCVPEFNSVISYSIAQKKFCMRIGGDTSSAFSNPTSVSVYKNELFVCNSGSNKIRSINLKDYSVADFKEFNEPVLKYIRSCDKEIVVLNSGVYIL